MTKIHFADGGNCKGDYDNNNVSYSNDTPKPNNSVQYKQKSPPAPMNNLEVVVESLTMIVEFMSQK